MNDALDARAGMGQRRVPVLLQSPHLVFWATFLVVCCTAMARTRILFSQAFYPSGDAAVNSLLVIRAEHLQLLVGNYSRVGLHHPGPGFLYGLAGAEVLLDKVLNLVPTPYNAQLLGTDVYVALMIALVAVVVFRSLASLGAALLVGSLCFVLLVHEGLFAQDWFPYLYMPAFLLFMVAGAAVGAGRTSELPVYALAVGLLVHGHVSFLMFTGVTTVAVALGWRRAHRGRVRDELTGHRRAWAGSLALVGLFALPLVVNTARHFPEPWRGYAHFASQGHREPRSAGEVIRFVARYWPETGVPVVVFIVAAGVALLLVITENDAVRRRLFFWLYGILALQTLLTTYYVARGVDFLQPRTTFGYVGLFYQMVPVLFLLAVAAHLWLRLVALVPARSDYTRMIATTAGAAVILGLVGYGATRPALHVDLSSPLTQQTEGFVEAVHVLAGHPARGLRRIALVPVDNDGWPAIAGVAVELAREGIPFCVDETYDVWRNMYTPAYACEKAKDVWRLGVLRNPPALPPGTVWQGVAAGHPTAVYAL